jgi:hypothetical protein
VKVFLEKRKKEKNRERQNRKTRRGGKGGIWGKQENSKITCREENRQGNGKEKKLEEMEVGIKEEINEMRKENQEVKREIDRLREEFKNREQK